MLILGVGSEFRGDDAAGPAVAKRLSALNLKGVRVIQHSGESVGLIDSWRDEDSVILVDAVRTNSKPGAIVRIDARDLSGIGAFGDVSSHGFGIGEAIKLAEAMNCLPHKLVVYGIEAKSFEHGEELSSEAEAAVGVVVDMIVEELKCTSLA